MLAVYTAIGALGQQSESVSRKADSRKAATRKKHLQLAGINEAWPEASSLSPHRRLKRMSFCSLIHVPHALEFCANATATDLQDSIQTVGWFSFQPYGPSSYKYKQFYSHVPAQLNFTFRSPILLAGFRCRWLYCRFGCGWA